MNRGALKRKAKHALKLNYGRCFVICFLVTLLVGGTLISTTKNYKEFEVSSEYIAPIEKIENSNIVNDFLHGINVIPSEKKFEGFLGAVFNNVTKSGSLLFGILNATNQFLFHNQIFSGIIISIGIVLSVLYWIFVASPLHVGQARFFLENRIYHKTKLNRVLLFYRVKKNIRVALALLRKNIYQILWCFTIVGGPIKFYAYKMVPYLLAENPNLTGKEAISFSIDMMKNHKWEAFLLDLSFLGYSILGLLTFNLVNLFYTKPYREAAMAEYYMYLRDIYSKDHSSIIYDIYLDQNDDNSIAYPEGKYPLKEHKNRNLFQSLDYNKKYSFSTYLLLFFSFSLIGWIWEVLLTLFSQGVFVNRGTFYGPWLPIYGCGGVLVIFLLQKFRKKPWLTFLFAVIICGILEYGTAFYLETFKHMKWWDYTGYFFNVHGRICLEGLLLFGIGGLAGIYLLAPLLDQFFSKWNSNLKKLICLLFVFTFLIDVCYSSKYPHVGEHITTEIKES